MCKSQKISWYKFGCQNTTLISLPTPPAISDFWTGIKNKALRNAPGWSSLCYHIFYIVNIFPVTLLYQLNQMCSRTSISHKSSSSACILLFLLPFSGPFYCFHLIFRIKWSKSNAAYMGNECKWFLWKPYYFVKKSSFNLNLALI